MLADMFFKSDFVLPPKPDAAEGTQKPVLSLCGEWNFAVISRYEDALCPNVKWTAKMVPDDVPAYLRLIPDLPIKKFAYKKDIRIPYDFAGKKIIIRFEGAQGACRVYCNGQYVTKHDHGYLTWDADITEFISDGLASVTVCFTNNDDEIIGDNLGGLVKPIWLIALPYDRFDSFHAETVFDEEYKNATLRIKAKITAAAGKKVTARYILKDRDGTVIDAFETQEASSVDERVYERSIKAPKKWDAEHPNLYRLEGHILSDNRLIEKIHKNIGFRQVKVIKNRLYVNGAEVKLRGACRHDITAHHGHYMTNEELKRDVLLFKEANINYIRTSHYPPYEAFLDLCDELGMYVEDEAAFAFIGSTLKFTPKEPHYAQRFLSFYAEMLERDKSHPSVIIWSLANESICGYNFDLGNEYVHATDGTRPTKFSYPMTVRNEAEQPDIWSVHYNAYYSKLGEKNDNQGFGYSYGADKPILNDEYAHLCAYNRQEIQRDPYIRLFWGEGLYEFWNNIYKTEGALGGAIWAGIDHTPCDYNLDHYEWGIVDIYRRKKPEFWCVKKAYSPIRLDEKSTIEDCVNGIKIENRYFHTNLNEVRVLWSNGVESGEVPGPDVKPFLTGTLMLPKQALMRDRLMLDFFDISGLNVESCVLYSKEFIKEELNANALPERKAVSTKETPSAYILFNDLISVTVDKSSGMISAAHKGRQLIKSGPYLNVPNMRLGNWELDNLDFCMNDAYSAVIRSEGKYGSDIDVCFEVTVNGNGVIGTKYFINRVNINSTVWNMKLRVGTCLGGLSEKGIYYLLTDKADSIEWKRKGFFSVYPPDNIGRLSGKADRFAEAKPATQSNELWQDETREKFLNGKYDTDFSGTRDFRAAKHNIIYANVICSKNGACIKNISDGAKHIRLETVHSQDEFVKCDDERIAYSGNWYKLPDAGCISGAEFISNQLNANVKFGFCGRGIEWYGSTDTDYGIAAVYIDGSLVDDDINTRTNIVDFAGSSVGFDKRYKKLLFAVNNLEYGSHTITIKVTGKKGLNATDAYISIDAFRVIGREQKSSVKMAVYSDYNFPSLSWGNKINDRVDIECGDSDEFTMILTDETNETDKKGEKQNAGN